MSWMCAIIIILSNLLCGFLKTYNSYLFDILLSIKGNLSISITARQFKRVCYFANWSNLRAHNQSRFYLSDIDLSLCTHILYAFAGIDVTNKQIKQTQAEDEYLTGRQGRYYDFTALKRTNPDLKTLLSVGGQDSDLAFSGIVTSPETIREFARNCRIYLYDRGFDGIDIGWEFPESGNKDNLTALLKVSRRIAISNCCCLVILDNKVNQYVYRCSAIHIL